MAENRIVIIGGGHGGSQVAASLRADGYDGPLTLVTAEREIPYQRPPLSKAFLKDPKHDLLPLRPELFYVKNHVDLRLGAEAVGDRSARGAGAPCRRRRDRLHAAGARARCAATLAADRGV